MIIWMFYVTLYIMQNYAAFRGQVIFGSLNLVSLSAFNRFFCLGKLGWFLKVQWQHCRPLSKRISMNLVTSSHHVRGTDFQILSWKYCTSLHQTPVSSRLHRVYIKSNRPPPCDFCCYFNSKCRFLHEILYDSRENVLEPAQFTFSSSDWLWRH